jgi:hypothetical protein
VRAEGGGAVWRHGGVIGRIDKVYAELLRGLMDFPMYVFCSSFIE